MEQKFYHCKHCGNIIIYAENSGVPVSCCGEKMAELIPGAVDAAKEKHIPVISRDNNNVSITVGSVLHPMQEEHYISWVMIETKQGYQSKQLSPNMAPKADYVLCNDDEFISAYAYCNLHGLWKAN